MKESIKDIEKYLPEGWEEKSKELKALSRGRQIKTAEELLALNLLYLTMGGSFGTTAALINMTTDKEMSKKAVYTRIQNSGEWLKWMSKEMCKKNNMLIPKPEWLSKNIKLVDGSVLLASQKILCKSNSKKTKSGLQSKHYLGFPLNRHSPTSQGGIHAFGMNTALGCGKNIKRGNPIIQGFYLQTLSKAGWKPCPNFDKLRSNVK